MIAKNKNIEREKDKHQGTKDVRKSLDIVKYRGFRFNFAADQLVNLTVLWKQMGALPKKKPALWLKTDLAKELILHLQQEESKGGAKQLLKIQSEHDGGTLGHWKLALAYSAFLSPKIMGAFVNVVRNRFKSEDSFDQTILYYTQATEKVEIIKKN